MSVLHVLAFWRRPSPLELARQARLDALKAVSEAKRRAVTIYALTETSGEVRYVGRTTQEREKRWNKHRSAALRGSAYPVHRWIAKRLRAGGDVRKVVLELVAPGDNWHERERYWIKHHRDAGARLLNLTIGGDGPDAFHIRRPRTAAQIAFAERRRLRQAFSCVHCGAKFERKPSETLKGHNKFCSRACKKASQVGVPKPLPAAFVEASRAAGAARQAARTHCNNGHELTPENLLPSRNYRACRLCHRANMRAAYERGKGTAVASESAR